jgi:hypothetical protein
MRDLATLFFLVSGSIIGLVIPHAMYSSVSGNVNPNAIVGLLVCAVCGVAVGIALLCVDPSA